MNKENDLYELSYPMKRELQQRIFSIVSICILVFVLITIFLRFVLFPVHQKSVSMEPDIVPGGWVLVSPLVKNPMRGDIVLLKPLKGNKQSFLAYIGDDIVSFFTAQQFFPFSSAPEMCRSGLLRRVVAVPGDTIYMTDYVVFIKPAGSSHYLTEFEYVPSGYKVNITSSPDKWDTMLGPKADFPEMKLGENEYFVLGDNRNSSVDSRLWGPVKAPFIKGKAVLQYFPFKKIKQL